MDPVAGSTAALAQQLSATMATIHRRGWCDGTGGNFSCVLDREPLQLLMAPSGVDKGSVAPEALIVVDAHGGVVRGEGKASAETQLHLALVETCGAGAVLHTHSQAGTLLSQHYAPSGDCGVAHLSLHDLEMLKGLEGITTHESSVAIPVLDNNQDLQRLRAEAEPHLRQAPHGLLIAGHGLYAWGRDLPTAHRHLEILEFLLEQHWRQLLLEALSAPRQQRQAPRNQVCRQGVTHVLLDIEGTTCPVSFVSSTLFPYAAEQLEAFLDSHRNDLAVRSLLDEVEAAWRQDADPEAQALRQQGGVGTLAYLRWLIRRDRKLTPLKDLQGLVWEQGYRSGALTGPLFADVPGALRRWHGAGLVLAVYSSGSVAAQRLIYGHSNAGDLRPLFSHWFDTRIGPKQAPESYATIAAQLGVDPEQMLFVSDALTECQAAAAAGMQVVFSDREGNPGRDPGPFERIVSFNDLVLTP
ncbi:acireductone synthase [Cyanobium sp. Alchichica 3B3-8F6]|uniref:acireductone synthase n=1 Tax=Cyanobium sp. Alchichica 3B3-8F6 TaxID=2823696 RepID=UPI0028F3E9FA|nr:acireductone synthase [Cyanobium sp. Alchichica 3B3-8F6]